MLREKGKEGGKEEGREGRWEGGRKRKGGRGKPLVSGSPSWVGYFAHMLPNLFLIKVTPELPPIVMNKHISLQHLVGLGDPDIINDCFWKRACL